MKSIIITRHAERLDSIDSSWILKAQYPGDTPLSENGHKQSKEIGKNLINDNIQHILCSPFLRARQTATHIANVLNKEIIIDPNLHEYIDINTTVKIEWENQSFKHESRSQMINRLLQIKNKTLKLNGNILLVSHGTPTYCLCKIYTGKFPEKMLNVAEFVKLNIN